MAQLRAILQNDDGPALACFRANGGVLLRRGAARACALLQDPPQAVVQACLALACDADSVVRANAADALAPGLSPAAAVVTVAAEFKGVVPVKAKALLARRAALAAVVDAPPPPPASAAPAQAPSPTVTRLASPAASPATPPEAPARARSKSPGRFPAVPDPETVRAPATTPLASPQRAPASPTTPRESVDLPGFAPSKAAKPVAATPDAKPRRKVSSLIKRFERKKSASPPKGSDA